MIAKWQKHVTWLYTFFKSRRIRLTQYQLYHIYNYSSLKTRHNTHTHRNAQTHIHLRVNDLCATRLKYSDKQQRKEYVLCKKVVWITVFCHILVAAIFILKPDTYEVCLFYCAFPNEKIVRGIFPYVAMNLSRYLWSFV